MRLAIDFDNTIVSYDDVFWQAAVECGLVADSAPVLDKTALRDQLRSEGCELAWTELQGYVYGPGMRLARPFPGVVAFFEMCRARGVPVAIISHRTRRPFAGPPHDLHAAARRWLDDTGFRGGRIGLRDDEIWFEETKAAKLERIATWGATHAVDDLPELLGLPEWPGSTTPILFDPNGAHVGTLQRASSWEELRKLLLDV